MTRLRIQSINIWPDGQVDVSRMPHHSKRTYRNMTGASAGRLTRVSHNRDARTHTTFIVKPGKIGHVTIWNS